MHQPQARVTEINEVITITSTKEDLMLRGVYADIIIVTTSTEDKRAINLSAG